MFCVPSTVDEHRRSGVHKTHCFPRSQSISDKCTLLTCKAACVSFRFNKRTFFRFASAFSYYQHICSLKEIDVMTFDRMNLENSKYFE